MLVGTVSIRLISIYRVGGQVAAGIQLSYLNRLAAMLLDINGNGSENGTIGIVAAEHLLKGTVGNVQDDVVIYVSVG